MSGNIFTPSSGDDLQPDDGSQKSEFLAPESKKLCEDLVKGLFIPTKDFEPEAETWAAKFNYFATNGQRIYYSIISIQIHSLSLENEDISDLFEENLKKARQFIPTENEKILLKFFDHINLCLLQVDLIYKVNEVTNTDFQVKLKKDYEDAKSKIEEQEKIIEDQKESISELTDNIETIKNNSKNIQREYVAVLGIFTAVILSFVSGTMFLNSALSNIHHVSFWRVSFTSLSIGIILFNILFALFMFIKRVLRENEIYPSYAKAINIYAFILLIFIAGCWHTNVGDLNEAEEKTSKSQPAQSTTHPIAKKHLNITINN